MNRLLVGGLLTVLVGIPLDAVAFDEADLAKLKETKACVQCDLAGAHFPPDASAWVYGQYVVGSGEEARISGAQVRIRSLPSTDKDSVVLGYFKDDEHVRVLSVRGDWVQVSRSVVEPILFGANLRWVNLSGAGLRGVVLTNADLAGADLTNVDLRFAQLSGASLISANLTGADLEEADLSGANLRWANLSQANLRWARLDDVNLKGAIVCNTIMPDSWTQDNSGC